MKLIYCNTKHQNVLRDEYFLPSIKDDIELCGKEIHISSKDDAPVFNSEAFKKATLEKVKYLIEVLNDNAGQIVIYSDVDIQFFRPFKENIKKELTGYDMVMQRNQRDLRWGGCPFCTGFFACKVNKRIIHLWKEVHRIMKIQDMHVMEDQKAFNFLIKPSLYKSLELNFGSFNKIKHFLKSKLIFSRIKIKYLPETYFTPGFCLKEIWRPGMAFEVPPEIILHHANWTFGLENKISQLQYVRGLVQGWA